MPLEDRERLLELCAKEIDTKNELEVLESPKRKEQPHCPKDTAKFLSLFNKRDGFKYLTHSYEDINSPFSYEKLINDFKQVFNTATKKLKVPISLYSLVRYFIFGQEDGKHQYWMSYRTKEKQQGSWSNDEWKQWASDKQSSPIENEEFKKCIEEFRHNTRIVPPDLKNMVDITIKDVNKQNRFKIEEIELEKADFLAFVPALSSAIKTILSQMCSERYYGYPNICISYKRATLDSDFMMRTIAITQKNSYPLNPLIDVKNKMYNQEGGDFSEIRRKLCGNCNWSIETIWDGKPLRWNILTDTNHSEIEEIHESAVTGFTHILTYYYYGKDLSL